MEDLQDVNSQQASLFALEASKIIFRSTVHTVQQDETCSCFFFQKVQEESSVLSSLKEDDGLSESIRKDASLRGVTISGSRGLQVNVSLYMDKVAVLCLSP
eukprot:g31244.t1